MNSQIAQPFIGRTLRLVSIWICIFILSATLTLMWPATSLQAASDPAVTAVEISELEAQGRFSEIYNQMHPDAQKFIPRSAVVGWYENEFGPLGPGVITVTGVRYVAWTWPVTGVTYPNTAEVSFQQPFANGRVVSEIVRLVKSGEDWKWFFGRSPEFVDEQISAYGNSAGSVDTRSGSCGGSAVWWQSTYPNIGATQYLAYKMSSSLQGGSINYQLMREYAYSFELIHNSQMSLTAPTAAQVFETDLLNLMGTYQRLAERIANLEYDTNPLAASANQSAIIQGIDTAGALELGLPVQIDTFVAQCEPLVVFVFGMGEDLPVGVLPGQFEVGARALDCELIESQVDAQDFFEAAGVSDPHRIDDNGNGIACEPGE